MAAGHAAEFRPAEQPCIHAHLVLDRKLSASRLIKSMKKRNILLEPIAPHYLSSFEKRNLLKINTSNVKEEDIRRGIEQLKQVIETAFY